MKKMSVVLVGILMAASIPVASMAADVNVNVQVAQPEVAVAAEIPPPLEVQNPEMVVVPSGNAAVYMVPNTYGVYFYNGHWFRYYNGAWFRSNVYNSGWVAVRPALVPRVVLGVYPEYAMYLPANYYRIGWGDFRSHWRGWGYGHWNRHAWFKNEYRHRGDRHRHIDRQRGEWGRGHGSRPHGYQHGPARHHGPTVNKGHGRPAPHGNAHKAAPHGGPHKTAPHGDRVR